MIIKRVTEYSELEGIKELQNKNLGRNISADEMLKEGFVTAEYTVEFLEKMHLIAPSIIAKDNDAVIGYALVSTKETCSQHDLLHDLYRTIDSKTFKETPLKNVNYVVVGQLCVDKNYRGQGLVQKMYDHYREQLSDQYDYLIADVHENNPRSVKAHLKAGFQIIDCLTYGGANWHIILWDWRN